MPEPVSLRSSIGEILRWFRDRGIDPDAPITDNDQPDRAEDTRQAIAYADAHIPARYADATATDPAIADWVERVAERANADSTGHIGVFARRGPSILILGPTGVGKTHQAYGALRTLATLGVRAPWVAVSAADLYARLRPRHGVDSETEFRSITDAPLLLVDDLGAAKTSEWVEEINYRLVNWRYERELPTVLTSNVPPKELSAVLGERVASRLVEMTDRITLKGGDRRRAGV